jgi:alpha-tubulin suppressor-like RCC1 family protein
MPGGEHARSSAIGRLSSPIGRSLGLAALLATLVVALWQLGLSTPRAGAAGASSAGELLAFGENGSGQLGLEGAQQTPTPTPVALPGASGALVQLAAGGDFSLALTASGQLYAFGDNRFGQLGDKTNNGGDSANATPTLVRLPGATGRVVQIAAGAAHSLALTATGQLYAFGDNRFGQLGDAASEGTEAANPTPTLVSVPAANGQIVQIAAGAADSLALTDTGQLYAFGDNRYGQLGDAANEGTETPNAKPALVSLPSGAGAPIAIAAGAEHSLVLTASGQVYAFGENDDGQLGRLANVESADPNSSPAQVGLPAGAAPASAIAAGGSHSLVLSANGSLYAFGGNDAGQLGESFDAGSEAANALPALVGLPSAAGAPIAIAAGAEDSLALSATGQLFAFGSNDDGQLGSGFDSGTLTANPLPRPVELPPSTTIDAVAQGSSASHTLALVADLTVLNGALPAGQIGSAYSASAVATGGAGGYTWSASGLPAGLAIDPASGQIGGTPTATGTSAVVLHVRDGFGVVASSATIALSVAALPSPARAFLSSTLTEAEIRASLGGQLGIKGSSARIASVRKHRSFTYGFTALTAGLLTIDWYYVPPGAHLARRAAPVLVAAGKLSFPRAGTRKITLRLTPSGRKLLRKRKRIALIATGSFTPTGKRVVTARASFVLKR